MNDLLDPTGRHRFWWSQLCAVPRSPRSLEYERLKRVWWDQTGCRDSFRDATKEVHLVCTLFENMVLFDPAQWIPELLEAAGIGGQVGRVTKARWSYEFEDGESKRICDVVISGRDEQGEFAIVVEAKRPGCELGEKDRPSEYLDLRPFQGFARRWLVFLLDETKLDSCRAKLGREASNRCGFVSWEQFAALQLALARRLDLPDVYRDFMAGAIQYQFCQHRIRPTQLAFGYLTKELAYEQMPRSEKEGGQSTPERREPLWRCDEET